MPYAILVSYEGQGKERVWEPTGIIFADGNEAGAYAKSENTYTARWPHRNRRYRAIKISEDDPLLWREREQKRFDDGIYQKVPWSEDLNQTGCYEHIDPDNSSLVRFIASQEDGLAGRYTSMLPGRFLRQFYGEISHEYVDRWCAQMGLDASTSELKVAITAEEIVHVYNNGPHSCMAYKITEPIFEAIDQHPVSVYGDSDIQVAYIERYGEITARCIIRADRGIYGRIYGDKERLLERLREYDYVEDWQGFAGARIRQLRTGKKLILPYIDGDLGVIKDGTDWLILSEQPHIIAKSPNGLPLVTKCMHCGKSDTPLKEWRGEDGDWEEPEYICLEGCKREEKPKPKPEFGTVDDSFLGQGVNANGLYVEVNGNNNPNYNPRTYRWSYEPAIDPHFDLEL